MGYVVENVTSEPIEIAAGEFIKPGPYGRLTYQTVPPDAIWTLRDQGKLKIESDEETFDERKADAEAFDPNMGRKETGGI